MKQKYLILLLVMFIVAAGFVISSTKMIKSKIKLIEKYDRTIKVEQEKLNSAKVLNQELNQVSKVIMNTMSKEKGFSAEEVNTYVKELADLADKYKIAVHSLFPKFIDAGEKHIQEQQYTLELDCTYIQIGQFLTDLEALDNIQKIDTFSVRPMRKESNMEYDDNQETHYKITLQLSTYKIVKEA